MKRSKKTALIVLSVIALVAAEGILCIVLRVAPTVDHALRIASLLQPVIDAKNQTMHISVCANFDGRILATESDVYLVTEDDTPYLALEQNSNAVYISGNILFLENGKAFNLGDAIQPQVRSYETLLPQIGALYEVLKITAEETDGQRVYSVTVTGAQAKILLDTVSLGETLPPDAIRELRLQLTEKNGKLHNIVFSGSGNADGRAVTLHVTLSGFRILSAGDYPIPEEVKQSAATVNRSELFSLTEDLYRLILALAPFADMEKIDGTLDLAVDCGLLQLNTQIDLTDMKPDPSGQLDLDALQKLPAILGFLCMEGDITCKPDGTRYEYALVLDQAAMQELARMILPELAQYSSNLSEGAVSIHLTDRTVTTMAVSLKGEIPILFTSVPVSVSAVFSFH